MTSLVVGSGVGVQVLTAGRSEGEELSALKYEQTKKQASKAWALVECDHLTAVVRSRGGPRPKKSAAAWSY